MSNGTIKSIRAEKGFGFISPSQGGQDLFFHHSAVTSGSFDVMQEGQQVSFEEGPDPRDPSRRRATNVQVVDNTGS